MTKWCKTIAALKEFKSTFSNWGSYDSSNIAFYDYVIFIRCAALFDSRLADDGPFFHCLAESPKDKKEMTTGVVVLLPALYCIASLSAFLTLGVILRPQKSPLCMRTGQR